MFRLSTSLSRVSQKDHTPKSSEFSVSTSSQHGFTGFSSKPLWSGLAAKQTHQTLGPPSLFPCLFLLAYLILVLTLMKTKYQAGLTISADALLENCRELWYHAAESWALQTRIDYIFSMRYISLSLSTLIFLHMNLLESLAYSLRYYKI